MPFDKFTDLLRAIGKKPGFYLAPDKCGRCESIRALKNFVLGLQMSQWTKDDGVLAEFTFWVCHHYGVPDGAMDWYGHILERAEWDEVAAFRLFFEHFEEYLKDRETIGAEGIKARFTAMLQQNTDENDAT